MFLNYIKQSILVKNLLQEVSEWRFVAILMDRIFLYLFLLVSLFGIVVLFLPAWVDYSSKGSQTKSKKRTKFLPNEQNKQVTYWIFCFFKQFLHADSSTQIFDTFRRAPLGARDFDLKRLNHLELLTVVACADKS